MAQRQPTTLEGGTSSLSSKKEAFGNSPRFCQSSKYTRENNIKNHGKVPKIFFIEFKIINLY
jgi:hypothetical protein